MLRVLAVILMCALPGAGFLPAPEKVKPPDRKPTGEKIDAKANRSLTGVVEKVQAKGEQSGTLKMRSSGPAKEKLYRYTFQVDASTKFLTAAGKALKAGLKSPRLARGAEVVVQFDDRKPGTSKLAPAGTHFALRIQLIDPEKK